MGQSSEGNSHTSANKYWTTFRCDKNTMTNLFFPFLFCIFAFNCRFFFFLSCGSFNPLLSQRGLCIPVLVIRKKEKTQNQQQKYKKKQLQSWKCNESKIWHIHYTLRASSSSWNTGSILANGATNSAAVSGLFACCRMRRLVTTLWITWTMWPGV